MDRAAQARCFAVGAAAGVLGSVAGLGGGVFAVPLLGSFTPLTPQQASGTSLASVLASSVVGVATFASEGVVHYPTAGAITLAALLTSGLGVKASYALSGPNLKRLLGGFLLCVAPLLPLRDALVDLDGAAADQAVEGGGSAAVVVQQATAVPLVEEVSQERVTVAAKKAEGAAAAVSAAAAAEEAVAAEKRKEAEAQKAEASAAPAADAAAPAEQPKSGVVAAAAGDGAVVAAPPSTLPSLACGSVAGFASGLFGVGGGVIITPMLSLTTALPQVQIVATSLAAIVLPAALGTAGHLRRGGLVIPAAIPLMLGATIGGAVGARLALWLPESEMRWLIALGLAASGFAMLRRGRR
eukprot:PLAT15244.1.p2 GENE.PLAT15244.1~~PLAT15244.1.p2  ORF type:complete len:390 (-),score=151.70 PLAT15244.1:193-1257(-)